MRDYGGVRGISHSASTTTNVIPEKDFPDQIHGQVGANLRRPECVLAHQSGLLIVPNWTGTGGISLISPTGCTHHILADSAKPVRPNGIALENDGSVLLAHMGETRGGIYRLTAGGRIDCVVTTVDGEPMPPTNFIVQDSRDRNWITVSTRKTPRASDYRQDACTGFIAVAEPGSTDATIVADGLGYTNECVIDERNGYVWVNETFGRRLTRFTLHDASGEPPRLENRQLVHEFGAGTYPDGLALDETGCLWITSIVSNRILKVSPCGLCTIMFEDSDTHHLAWTETAFQNNTLGREHLDKACGAQMKNVSNLAFGGPDRCRMYLGNLLGDSLPYFDTQTRGVAMPHWDVDLGPLKHYTTGNHS